VQEYLQVLTAAGTRADACRMASVLVEKRLAGCVQVIGPIESTYRWKGRVERSPEWLCLVKTSQARYNELVSILEAIHPYDVPEILAVPVTRGSGRYLAWLGRSLKPARRRRRQCR